MKKDRYLSLNYCCKWPSLVLTWEQTLGYPPFVYCSRCNSTQEFKEEEE